MTWGSRDTTREAFAQGLIRDGDLWMAVILHRNFSAHAHDQAAVQELEARLEERSVQP
ncbi:nucleotidyltransferase substrate binding protein [Cyanobium sp. LEGE 06143]|uniref:nucleotidyltransferase substrate binding protein n=1 Tax=Cyanobium sp. LEGE 06143 TaxID=945727 RepID=UPI001881F753|nr:nucleotidyltransferase substrate binding protein [Cyanobium sp. LEGE 06143]MBE9171898.1 nucleotidyltransferase substrate binding protein [Cyanobium sp. LEGE 06143]